MSMILSLEDTNLYLDWIFLSLLHIKEITYMNKIFLFLKKKFMKTLSFAL